MYSVRPNFLIRKLYPAAIWRIPPASNLSPFGGAGGGRIYLTFDDGPIPEITPWVLALLKQYNAKATFFCVGENIDKHPDIFQQILSEGHAIGNHTHNHLNGWKVKNQEYFDNISNCDSSINSNQSSVNGDRVSTHSPPTTDNRLPLFRPPYGRMKPSQYSILNTQYSLIMWDVLSGDFDQSISEEKCLQNVLTKTREGSIVVFHDSIKAKKNLMYALPKFLEHFSEKGFVFSPLSATP